jgi:hypothetical protein
MPRSYAHTFESKYKRKKYEFRLMRERLNNYKLLLSQMISKGNKDENYMRFLNLKIERIENLLYNKES